MWDVKACRACLDTEGKLAKIGEASKRIFTAVTGLEMHPEDGYPMYFCQECRSHIRRCLQFRRKARRAFYVLKEIMTIKKRVTFKDVQQVDRKKTNLVSPYGSFVTNTVIYDVVAPEIEGTMYEEIVQEMVAELQSSDEFEKQRKLEKITDNEKFKFKVQFDPNNKECQYKLEITSQLKPSGVDIGSNFNIDTKSNIISKDNALDSVTLVNIKPDNYKEIERELYKEEQKIEEEKEVNEEKETGEIQEDDFDNREFAPEEEIDMDDVFKGLEDKQESETESLPELPVTSPPKRKRKRMETHKPIVPQKKSKAFTKHVARLSIALCNSRIRLLTIEEQREMFNAELLRPSFLRAQFKCSICLNTAFSCLEELVAHVRKHNKEKKLQYACVICKRRFRTEEELTKHSAQMHWYEYECNTCGSKYNTTCDLVNCFVQHVENGKLVFNGAFTSLPLSKEAMYRTMDYYTGLVETYVKCNDCNIGFENIHQLTAHLNQHLTPQNAEQIFECDICHLKFTKRNKLSTHMKQWHLFSYICNLCNVIFMNRKQAFYHKVHNLCGLDNSNELFTCKFCGKKIKLKTEVLRHMNLRHYNKYHNKHCNECGDFFSSTFKLYRHQLGVHDYFRLNHHELGDPRYVCVHCNVFFVDEKAYQKHVVKLAHDEAKDIPNGCTLCRRLFDSVDQREAHKCKKSYQTHSKAIYPQPCCYCDVQLSSHMQYSSHMRTVHKGLMYKPITGYTLCELCGKTVSKKAMRSHIKLHHDKTGTSVPCGYCPEIFNEHTSAVSHILTNHTHKPYLCAICPMRCNYRCELRDHILKVHAPVMPYYCNSCKRGFSHLDYLNDHSVKIHGVNIKNPSVYLPRRKPRRVVLYPHMKIDCTLIDNEYLAKAEVQICDYLDENEKKLDNYLEHVVFNNIDDAVTLKANKKMSYPYNNKKKRIKKNTVCSKNAKIIRKIITIGDKLPITSESDVPNILNENNCNSDGTQESRQIENRLAVEVLKNIEGNEEIIDDAKEGEDDSSIQESTRDEEIIAGYEDVVDTKDICGDNSMDVETIEESFVNHEVIEMDGCEYVMIGDTLYKIEVDNDN